MASDVYIEYFSKGWSGTDYGAGIQYAEDQDWLKNEGSVIRLLIPIEAAHGCSRN